MASSSAPYPSQSTDPFKKPAEPDLAKLVRVKDSPDVPLTPARGRRGAGEDEDVPPWARSASAKSAFATLLLSTRQQEKKRKMRGVPSGEIDGGLSEDEEDSSFASPVQPYILHTILRRPPPPFVDPEVIVKQLSGSEDGATSATASPSRRSSSRRRILLPDDLRESFIESHATSTASFHETKSNVELPSGPSNLLLSLSPDDTPAPSPSNASATTTTTTTASYCRLRCDLVRGLRARNEEANERKSVSDDQVVWLSVTESILGGKGGEGDDGTQDEEEGEVSSGSGGEQQQQQQQPQQPKDAGADEEESTGESGGSEKKTKRRRQEEVVPLHLRHMSSLYSEESIQDIIGSLGGMIQENSEPKINEPRRQISEDDPLSKSIRHNSDARVLQKFMKHIPAKLEILRLKRRLEKREHVARELLATELAYVDHLRVIREVYVNGLNELPERLGHGIFGKVFDSMYGLGDSMANSIQQCMFKKDGEFDQMCLIGKVVKKHAPFLSMYKQYSEQFEDVAKRVREYKKRNSEFLRTIQMLDQDERTTKLGINSYLILPIQRIPRYRLLLSDLLKNTDPDHPDHEDLEVALESILRVAAAVNLAIHEHELHNVLLTLDDKFLDLPSLSVFEHGGKELVARFDLLEGLSGSPNPRELVIHLFNHLIVFSTPKRGRTEEETRFVVKSELSVKDTAIAIPKSSGSEGSFRLSSVLKETHEVVHMQTPDGFPDVEGAHEACKKIMATIVAASKGDAPLGTGIEFDLTTKGISCQGGLLLSPENCLLQLVSYDVPLVRISSSRSTVALASLVQTQGGFLLRCEDDTGRFSSVDLSPENVTGLVPGQLTEVFQLSSNAKVGGLAGVSFSILLQRSSVDFIARSKREYKLWTRALRLVLSKPILKDVGRAEMRQVREDIGDIYTWGENQFQCLGQLLESDHLKLPRVLKRFLCLDIQTIAIGKSCCFAVTRDGEVFSWGSGKSGCLGHKLPENKLSPSLIKSLRGCKIIQVAAGEEHTLFLDRDGDVRSCGSGACGQLGLFDVTGCFVELQTTPRVVPFFEDKSVMHIDAGAHHSAAVTSDFKLYTWGKCSDGQLGIPLGEDDGRSCIPVPVEVDIGERFKSVACGLWHTLALTCGGDVYAWGDGTDGQVGVPVLSEDSGRFITPVRLSQDHAGSHLPRMKDIAAGSTHSALLSHDGSVYMFGSNIYGQLGVSKSNKRVCRPMKIALFGCCGIALGAYHGLALVEIDGTKHLMSWGYGVSGRLGLEETEVDVDSPRPIKILSRKDIRSVHAGAAMSAVVVGAAEIPKDETDECMTIGCRHKFTKKFVGKTFHRCVNCRGVYCKKCVSRRIRFPMLGEAILPEEKVCDDCYDILKAHFGF